jgi:cobalt-zinc-cadmium efflux system outer membrane protein
LKQLALASRPDLRTVQIDQARSQADLKLQVAQGKIDYTYGAEYRRQQSPSGRSNSLGFFFSAPLPMFNRNQGEIERAQSEHRQLEKSFDALREQVFGEVINAWQEYETARALVLEIERDLLAPSEEARSTVAYVYQAGASSLIDVLDSQRAYNETMSTYYAAQADYRRAASKLAAAVGEEVVR